MTNNPRPNLEDRKTKSQRDTNTIASNNPWLWTDNSLNNVYSLTRMIQYRDAITFKTGFEP